jgi:hypothetical protein
VETDGSGSNQILKQVRITRVIENPSFQAGKFANKTITVVPQDSLDVHAKYLTELNYLHRFPLKTRKNTLCRVSPCFPAFDFIVFDDTGRRFLSSL